MSCLPEELWKVILTHVPLPQRLGSCSRVSQKLCRAAAAATEQLQVQLGYNVERSEGLKCWLQHSGQHISSLRLVELSGNLTQLPCPQLQQLCVDHVAVLLGPSSDQPGILHSCSSLTKIELLGGWLLDVSRSLAALSAVPALQHMELSFNVYDNISMPCSILQVLTQLTFMRLGSGTLADAKSLQHVRALQHLQVLELYQPALPLSPSSTPGLAQLTALSSIGLSFADLDVTLLQPYRNLQSLVLDGCTLLGGAGAAMTLLSVVGQQSQLQQLVLSQMECEWPRAAAAYAAVTVSSRLQQLHLPAEGLPAGIWQAVLRPDQHLPELTSLSILNDDTDDIEADVASFCSQADINRLIGCCPGLCSLGIDLQPDVQLQRLSQLTGLTSLTVRRVSAASVISLQCLSGLKKLNLAGDAALTTVLLRLTDLRRLTFLLVGDGGLSALHFNSSQDPDVWLQLLEHCTSTNTCHPAIVRGLGLQLAEQQDTIQEQNRQLQQQAADAVELRGRVVALEGQMAQLMQALQQRG